MVQVQDIYKNRVKNDRNIFDIPALLSSKWFFRSGFPYSEDKRAGISKMFLLFFTLFFYIPWVDHFFEHGLTPWTYILFLTYYWLYIQNYKDFQQLEHLIGVKILVAQKIITFGTGARQFGVFLYYLAFSRKCPPKNKKNKKHSSLFFLFTNLRHNFISSKKFYELRVLRSLKLTCKQNFKLSMNRFPKFWAFIS